MGIQDQSAGPAPRGPSDPVAPPGYRLVEQRRILGSVVRAVWQAPDGGRLEWTSRGFRKGRRPVRVVAPGVGAVAESGAAAPAAGEGTVTAAERNAVAAGGVAATGGAATAGAASPVARSRTPWFGFAPQALSWWIAVVFTTGSVFFVVGSAGAVTGPTRWWPNPVYFVGSVLFTIGAALQLREIHLTGRDVLSPSRAKARGLRRFSLYRPGRLDWNAAVIQQTGTLLFNINCFFGMSMSLTHRQEDFRVWVPSTVASVFFVSSSWLSLLEAEGRWFSWRPRQLEWWITVGSLLGSWGFLVSSLTGFFLGGDLASVVSGLLGPHGETLWLEYAVDGVLLFGSCWFLVGTYLLIPEALRAIREQPAPRPASGSAAP